MARDRSVLRNVAADELELLLQNAIIVFETTSLLMRMIVEFQLKGFAEFQCLKETIFKELAEAESNSQQTVFNANNPAIPLS